MSKFEWFLQEDINPALASAETRDLNLMALLPQRMVSSREIIQDHVAPDARLWWGVLIHSVSITLMQSHWSRLWEYPWIVKNGDFQPHHKVMDAGGCCSILPYRLAMLCKEVVVCDLDEQSWNEFTQTDTYQYMRTLHNLRENELSYSKSDIGCLPYPDGYFDRVTCVSVLEHTSTPLKIIQELVRVTAPGGRLLVTMDISDRVHEWNGGITLDLAKDILNSVGMELTPPPSNIVTQLLLEEPPGEEPYKKEICVLGFWYDKQC